MKVNNILQTTQEYGIDDSGVEFAFRTKSGRDYQGAAVAFNPIDNKIIFDIPHRRGGTIRMLIDADDLEWIGQVTKPVDVKASGRSFNLNEEVRLVSDPDGLYTATVISIEDNGDYHVLIDFYSRKETHLLSPWEIQHID